MHNKLLKVIIIAFLVIMIITAISIAILYFVTDIFKSKEVLFQKYLSENFVYFFDFFDFSYEQEIDNILKENDYMTVISGDIKYLEKENDEEEIYEIKAANIIKNSEKNKYEKMELYYDKNTLATVEMLNEKEKYGIKFPNIVNSYITVKNESLPYILSSLGYNSEYISEKLNDVDFSDVFNFTNEEIISLEKTYINACFYGIDKNSYSSKNKVITTLKNGESIYTTAYTLTLTKSDLDKVYKRILNHTSENEIILGKIDLLDEKIKNAGFNLGEKSLRERFKDYLSEIHEKIEYSGENNDTVTITVYRNDNKTIKTSLKDQFTENSIEIDLTQGNKIYVKKEDIVDEKIETTTYIFKKLLNDNQISREISYSGVQGQIKLNLDIKKDEQNIQKNMNVEYSTENIVKICLDINKNIEIKDDLEMPVRFKDEKKYLLNNHDENEIEDVIELMKEEIKISIKESQEEIHTKFLEKIIDYINEKQNNKEEELEKQRAQQIAEFNNRFELYAGEDLEYDNMKRLLEVISNNMDDYEVISNKKIRIYLKEDNINEPKFKEIKDAITNKYKYDVKLNYNEDKKIESIDISIHNKN